jgi:vancomycin permeability regulator SanA
LEDQGIPSDLIKIDVLGIRTLDSCQRASSIFNIKQAYLVSQAYHLARASFLCRQEGMEVVPVSAEDSCTPIYCSQIIREIGASWLAVLNISGVSGL